MNMDGNKITKGILMAFGVLVAVIGIVAGFYFGIVLVNIILGYLFSITATLGVGADTIAYNDNISASFYATANNLLAGQAIASNLIGLAIVLVVLGGLVFAGYKGYKAIKGRSGAGGSY